MFAELIARLFASRDYGHRAHLATGSYAQHKALNDFYDTLTDLIDKLVECYQGRHGVVEFPYIEAAFDKNCVATLTEHLKMIEAVRDQAVGNDRPLQNIVDEICGVYLQTLYKLKVLN